MQARVNVYHSPVFVPQFVGDRFKRILHVMPKTHHSGVMNMAADL